MIADILKRRNKESYMSLVRSSAFKVHLEFRFMTSLRDPLDLPDSTLSFTRFDFVTREKISLAQ